MYYNTADSLRSTWGWATWKRPSQVWTTWSLWGTGGVRPGDNYQGYIGDCWYVSTMAALGEWPDRIKSMFTNADQARGIYELKMWENGRPKKVVIDDWIAMYSSTSPMMIGKSSDGAIWPILVEKAGAKYYGTYERLVGGFFGDAYYSLTGRPHKTWYPTPTATSFFEILKKGEVENDVMWAATYATAGYNLVGGHAYTLLGARDYTDAAGKAWQLVQLRNPWGYREYNGAFSDYDTVNMNTYAKTALNHTLNTGDGTFWMPFSTYAATF